uniref:MUTSd domain-containing protein n=1 Tax=Angiostrongylus cantonensis TaxID=6313 RepID=A0A0K0D446_ANGCA
MQSCCALIKYVEQIQNIVFASKALRFLYRDIEKMCLLGKLFGVSSSILTSSLSNLFNISDVGSWCNLEVLNTDPKKVVSRCANICCVIVHDFRSKARSSLLAIVDETLTSGGSRLLRSNLLQPSADQDVIEQRLDAVEELVNNPHVVEKLRQLLDNTYNLDHFFNVFVESPHERTLRTADFHVTQLLNDERIDTIKELLDKQFHSDGFVSRKKSSINLRHQRCYAIKEGVSVNLDIARRAYEELLRDIEAQEEELSTHFPGENTRMAFSTSRGFHYVWLCRDASSVVLPPVFINVVRNRSSVTFTSRNLVRYNDRIEQSLSEVMIATDLVVQHVIKEVRPLIAVLYHVVDCLSTTDMLCSFAVYAFNKGDTGRHANVFALLITINL